MLFQVILNHSQTVIDDAISFIYDRSLPNTMNRCNTSNRLADEHLIFVERSGTKITMIARYTCVIVAIAAYDAGRDARPGEVLASLGAEEAGYFDCSGS